MYKIYNTSKSQYVNIYKWKSYKVRNTIDDISEIHDDDLYRVDTYYNSAL